VVAQGIGVGEQSRVLAVAFRNDITMKIEHEQYRYVQNHESDVYRLVQRHLIVIEIVIKISDIARITKGCWSHYNSHKMS
jgi:hypothetical protein